VRGSERVETELGWEFIQIYGLTETSPLLTMNRAPAEWDGLDPTERSRRLARAGAPVTGIRLAIDPDGEVLAQGNHIFEGYWNQPEVAVIGVPHDKWGETVKGLVVLRPGASATEAELIEHCRSRLSHYKCPTSVEFRDALSRTATGKLQKFKLREDYWKGRDRLVN
jgi:fatty-acyl-CoA synthase